MASNDPSPSSPSAPSHEPFRLRAGTHLLGRYEGSAYEQPTYLVRRDDGQVIHLSHLLYLVAQLLDGERDATAIAEALSTEIGRQVVADNVEYLVETKLRPTGLMASESDQATPLAKSLPLLALRYRKRVIPARLHRGVSTALQPLFWPPVVLLVLGALVATNVWLFGTDRTALIRAARQLPFHPDLFLLVTVLVIFSGFFHELGHATATRYGGGSPGVMGVGIYLAWPAFYTDLTDSYRLNRRGRLRSDLGGVYFNAVLIVVAGIAYLTTGFGPLALFIVVSQAMAMYQFLPFIRLDGYYIVSDLVGVPNLFAYLGPVLKSMFRRPDPVTNARLHLLKRRARVAIKVWSIVTIAFLAFNFGAMAVMAPIILPAEWASIHLQGEAMVAAFARESVALGLNDLIDLIVVAIAPVGMLLIVGILLRRALQAIKKWWPTHPKVAAAFAALLAGVLLFQGQGLVGRLTASPGSSGPTVMATHGARPTPPATRSHPPSSRPARSLRLGRSAGLLAPCAGPDLRGAAGRHLVGNRRPGARGSRTVAGNLRPQRRASTTGRAHPGRSRSDLPGVEPRTPGFSACGDGHRHPESSGEPVGHCRRSALHSTTRAKRGLHERCCCSCFDVAHTSHLGRGQLAQPVGQPTGSDRGRRHKPVEQCRWRNDWRRRSDLRPIAGAHDHHDQTPTTARRPVEGSQAMRPEPSWLSIDPRRLGAARRFAAGVHISGGVTVDPPDLVPSGQPQAGAGIPRTDAWAEPWWAGKQQTGVPDERSPPDAAGE